MDGKVVIVTGAASGIGRAIALLFARKGARVVITDVDAGEGAAAAMKAGDAAIYLPLDVTDEEQWKAVLGKTQERFARLDVLVNNAGIGSPEVAPENVDIQAWRRVQQINLEGTLLGCKYAMPMMRDGGGGAIINISSVAAFVPTANDLVYGASKAGVRQLTQSLALHCARNRSGIRVNSVHPGAIVTPGVVKRRSAEILDQVSLSIPMGHMGEPDDIAHATLFLASDDAKYITGQALIVDGGYMLSPVAPSAPPT
jgi:NAD(P)-dependent dehydrogenase (short-subunit alcohol dehydrogenase family)